METTLTRRKFLGSAAGAVAGTAALSGSASALASNSSVYTTVALNVRHGPGTGYGVKATADQYTGGINVGGPEYANGYTWWKTTFNQDSDNGAVTGWVAEGNGWLVQADFSYPASGTVTSTYYDTRNGNCHCAIDIANDTGTPLHACRSGTAYTGWDADGYGNYVVIDHGNGWETRYGHMSQFYVSNGEWVYWDQQIGEMGNTGYSFGSHVHYEIWYNGSRVYLPPSASYEQTWHVARTGVPKNFF